MTSMVRANIAGGEMARKIYEIIFKVSCGDLQFTRSDWKVLDSEEEARAYGLREQDEFNEGLTPSEKAHDGYCYEYWWCCPVENVDGYGISVDQPQKGCQGA